MLAVVLGARLSHRLGPKYKSVMDSECHVAFDCMSRTPKGTTENPEQATLRSTPDMYRGSVAVHICCDAPLQICTGAAPRYICVSVLIRMTSGFLLVTFEALWPLVRHAGGRAGGKLLPGVRAGGRRRVASGRAGESAYLDGLPETHFLDKISIYLGKNIISKFQKKYAPIHNFKIS